MTASPLPLLNSPAAGGTGADAQRPRWQRDLKAAFRTPAALAERLGLNAAIDARELEAAEGFPLLVPESYAARMTPGDPADPLLRQVWPAGEETAAVAGFGTDPVGDAAAVRQPGILQKYAGRALAITTGACAVHCRYGFRRHYPYAERPRSRSDWAAAIERLAADATIREVILSGGDPLLLSDDRLAELVALVEAAPHVTRLRWHSRTPIVLPSRITDRLLNTLSAGRLQTVFVLHANHAAELTADCAAAVARLVANGHPVLNQAVLLKGVNDSVAALHALAERLADLGVVFYYLHALDPVAGAAHFAVPDAEGKRLVDELATRTSGYAVPRFVREIAGASGKTPVG